MLLATINSGTLIIALPDLERSLGTSLLQLVWVILAYMISSTVLVLTAGRLSDLFGRKKAYVGGFILFTLASLGAGFANNGTELILWRIFQGVGAAFLFANAAALVTDAFPREQLGVAMGTNTMVAAVGLVIGPVLGGALVAIGWQWVFWFNIPLGLAGAVWGALILHELAKPDTERGLDLLGTGVFLVGLTGLVYGVSKGGISGWTEPIVIVSLAVAAVLLPLFVLIEQRATAPMLDLSIFKNRMFAAATGAAFINGLSRFALLFIFVFYFQGVQGDDPITAGIKLSPMAIGMLIASPARRDLGRPARVANARRARHAGLRRRARGDDHARGRHRPYWETALWLGLVGIGSGMFNSPNTAAMMGTVPPNRRGIAAGARMMLQNTGAVLSIAFVIAIVTSGVPKEVLFKIFSGLASGLPTVRARHLHPQHAHRPLGPGRHLADRRRRLAAAAAARASTRSQTLCRLRIGSRHERAAASASGTWRSSRGTTPRTIRYYEEIGLLPSEQAREPGAHRTYGDEDLERLQELLRLRELLGVSLEELARAGCGRDRPRLAAARMA